MVLGEGIIAFLLLNEARHRVAMRVFGVSRRDSNRVTVIALGSLAGGLYARGARLARVPAPPSVAATAIGAAGRSRSAEKRLALMRSS